MLLATEPSHCPFPNSPTQILSKLIQICQEKKKRLSPGLLTNILPMLILQLLDIKIKCPMF